MGLKTYEDHKILLYRRREGRRRRNERLSQVKQYSIIQYSKILMTSYMKT
jgi:hypothetical protein